jgi:hypothetical protein
VPFPVGLQVHHPVYGSQAGQIRNGASQSGVNLKVLRQSEERRILHWYLCFRAIYPVEVARIHLVFEDGTSEDDQK